MLFNTIGLTLLRRLNIEKRDHALFNSLSIHALSIMISPHKAFDSTENDLLGTFRSLRFVVGWPLKSCTHTVIFPSVSGSSAVKRKPRKVPIASQIKILWYQRNPDWIKFIWLTTIDMSATCRIIFIDITSMLNMGFHKDIYYILGPLVYTIDPFDLLDCVS